MSDLVGNPEDQFSRDGAQIVSGVSQTMHTWIRKIFSVGGPNSQKGSDGKFQHGKN